MQINVFNVLNDQINDKREDHYTGILKIVFFFHCAIFIFCHERIEIRWECDVAAASAHNCNIIANEMGNTCLWIAFIASLLFQQIRWNNF